VGAQKAGMEHAGSLGSKNNLHVLKFSGPVFASGEMVSLSLFWSFFVYCCIHINAKTNR
jgi:hypothetical protein